MPRTQPPGDASPEQIAAAVTRYVPQTVTAAQWALIATFVRTLAIASEPKTFSGAYQVLQALTRFVAWAVERDIPLDAEVMLTEANVEHFIQTALPNLVPHSRNAYRSCLRRVGRATTKRAEWRPRPTNLGRRQLSAPYAPDEISWLWYIARNQPTVGRRRAAVALMALGHGAGLQARELAAVTAAHLTWTDDGGVTVDVPGPRSRAVPVLSEGLDDLRWLAADFPDRRLFADISPSRTAASNVIYQLVVPPRAPRFHTPRLRSTWMVTLLTAGIRLSELVALAGVTSTKNLQDLILYIPKRPDQDVRALLRGIEL